MDDLKTAPETTSTKSSHQYYIVKKYEVMQCGDFRKKRSLSRRDRHLLINLYTM
ncbi:hypothetical protein DPMN_172110 [Dreissena polymorpha]|uniref:Uncharacterized protein n=1 Tax=Dreissena polymorpha TaxID=45954 RepID=A0A9D4E1P6_DREPO|nr:hypothetical protein DPMN_172110 [Dreissena polymorpha]